MVLDVGPTDFALMLADLGKTITRRTRSASGTDALGNPTYTASAPANLTAIVQDIRTDDRRALAGILQPGDKEVFLAGADSLGPLDEVTIEGRDYRILEGIEPSYGDGPVRPYRSYLLRTVAG